MNKITIGILTFNHEKFIAKCLHSVLALKYDNLEIIVSDDCSKDNTYQIVQDIVAHAQSSHHIILNRNEINLGLAGNFNKTFGELATGDFLVTLGGDDAIKDDYFAEVLAVFEKDNQIMMVDVNADIIDENGVISRRATDLEYDQKLSGLENYLALEAVPSFAPGRMIRKELLSYFFPISHQCPTEDSVLVVRSLLLGKHCRLNKSPILYRRHSENVSTEANLKKMSNIRIVSQYIKDAITLYDNSLISDEFLLRLLARFEYEHKRRIIIYSDLNKYIKIIKRRLIKIKYKFQ
ncbi:glycosyltransferase [Kaistella sp. BT6-1-3]|uniref:Glycosyltransferase n=1 Tax=Kaistella yananensis TaxID=2989820 RepID=A0ABT3JJ20_9FLAO|nr:glycosyltransferase [Kaistella yananensis]MCW4450784.1 glycosyltransferase [Kaistella yananensis]